MYILYLIVLLLIILIISTKISGSQQSVKVYPNSIWRILPKVYDIHKGDDKSKSMSFKLVECKLIGNDWSSKNFTALLVKKRFLFFTNWTLLTYKKNDQTVVLKFKRFEDVEKFFLYASRDKLKEYYQNFVINE